MNLSRNKEEAEAQATDSLQLCVAVMPTLASLPIYYAKRIGLTDSTGINMCLLSYPSFIDIDTAVTGGHIHLFLSDSIHLNHLSKNLPVHSVARIKEPLSLLLNKSIEAKKLTMLHEKMIAISRHCSDETWCHQLLDSARMSIYDVYRPQIHDLPLRTSMLQSGLMDAAILPDPYATLLREQGFPMLAFTSSSAFDKHLVLTDSCTYTERKEIINRFLLCYNVAIDMIRQGIMADTLRLILRQEYGLSVEESDSIHLQNLSKITLP